MKKSERIKSVISICCFVAMIFPTEILAGWGTYSIGIVKSGNHSSENSEKLFRHFKKDLRKLISKRDQEYGLNNLIEFQEKAFLAKVPNACAVETIELEKFRKLSKSRMDSLVVFCQNDSSSIEIKLFHQGEKWIDLKVKLKNEYLYKKPRANIAESLLTFSENLFVP